MRTKNEVAVQPNHLSLELLTRILENNINATSGTLAILKSQLDAALNDKKRFSELDTQVIKDSIERQRIEIEQLLKRFPQYSW